MFKYDVHYQDTFTGRRVVETVYASCARDAMPKARAQAGLGTAGLSSWILAGIYGTDGICKTYIAS